MIPAASYDFVNAPAGFIHNRGAGFVSASPMPTLEDAAYMREILRTAEAWNGYQLWSDASGYIGDAYPAAGLKDDIPMMPKKERWAGDLETVRGILGAAGKRNRYRGALTDLYTQSWWSGEWVAHQLQSSWVINNFMEDTAGAVVSDPTDKTMPRFDTKAAWGTAAGFLQNWRAPLPMKWYLRSVSELYGFGSSMENFLNEVSYQWELNGSPTSYVPGGFLRRDEHPDYGPPMYLRHYTSVEDSAYAREGSWNFRFSSPTWTHGRTDGPIVEILPIFSIRLMRLWKFTGESTFYDKHDARWYQAFWCPGWYYDPFMYLYYPRAEGGFVNLSIKDGTIKAMCDRVLTMSGAPTWVETTPHETVPSGYTASVDGYEAYVDLVACLFTRSYVTRDLGA